MIIIMRHDTSVWIEFWRETTRDGSGRSINPLPMSIAPTPARNEREITDSLRLSTVKAGLILDCGWITPMRKSYERGC